MVNSATWKDAFPGRSSYYLEMRVSRADVDGHRTKWKWSLYATNPSRSRLTYVAGTLSYSVTLEGEHWSGVKAALDFRDGAEEHLVASGTTGWKTHSSTSGALVINGNANYGGSIFGVASPSGSFTAYAYTVPGRMPKPTLKRVSATAFDISYGTLPATGGTAIDGVQHRYSINSNFSPVGTVLDILPLQHPYHSTGRNSGETYYVQTRARNSVGYGPWSPTASVELYGPPSRPARPTLVTLSPTSMEVTIVRPATNGAPIIEQEYQVSTESDFSTIARSFINNYTTTRLTGYDPATRYYVRFRSRNKGGWSSWSLAANTTTMPAEPPTLVSATPAVDGTELLVEAKAPSGLSVDEYIFEFTIGNGTTIYTRTSDSATLNIVDRTPGTVYNMAVRYRVGEYTSDKSNVITVRMPNPTTEPGDYFDGSSDPSGDMTYQWTGTANASASTGTSKGGVLGWTQAGTVTAGIDGEIVQMRSTATLTPGAGVNAALYVVRVAPTEHGVRFGPDASGANYGALTPAGGRFVGSIWVRSPRGRTVAPAWTWFDDAGNELDFVVGPSVTLAPGKATRLSLAGVAPLNAARGAVVATDPEDSEFFVAGDVFYADAAMVSVGSLYPYFNGNTADTDEYTYDWEGAAQSSASYRTEVELEEGGLLRDPDCPPPPKPPKPPQITDECVDSVGSWRRYWVNLPASQTHRWMAVVPTVTIRTGAQAARQVRLRYHQNANGVLAEDANDLPVAAEQIERYIPAHSEVIVDGISEHAWARVRGSETLLRADHLLYGSGGGPATWAPLECGTPYLLSFDAPSDSSESNLTFELELTTRRM